jgi:hypothetical protein
MECAMALDWNKLTALTGGRPFVVERVRTAADGIAIEGLFELPPLARLTAEDQAFVAAFVHSHGSIKQMEAWFGVSYPTIKNRLNRIAGQLAFVEVDAAKPSRAGADDTLGRLERSEITVEEALEALKGRSGRRKSASEQGVDR